MQLQLSLFFIIAFVAGQLTSVTFSGIRISLLDGFVLLFVVLTAIKIGVPQFFRAYSKLFWPFILATVCSLILQFNNFLPAQIGIASLYLIRFILYTSIIIATAYNSNFKKNALSILFYSGLGIAVAGLFQYFLYPNLRNLSYLGWDPHQYRVFSTLLDPNFTGIIMVLTIFLSVYLFEKKILSNLYFFISNCILLITLLLTYSRGSFITFLVGACIWSVLKRKLSLFVVICLLFAVSLVVLPRPGGEGVNLFRSISIGSRIDNSQQAFNLFLSHPLLGIGFNTVRLFTGSGVHNSFLFILVTTGIFGFLAYFWSWNKIINLVKPNSLMSISLTVVAVHSLFDNSLFYPYVMVWLGLLIGSFITVDR